MKLLINILAVASFALPINVLVAAEKKAATETKEAAKPATKDPHAGHKSPMPPREGSAVAEAGHDHHGGDCCDQKDCCKDCDHKNGKHSCCDDTDKAKECCKNCDSPKCKKACKSGHCKKGHCDLKKKAPEVPPPT